MRLLAPSRAAALSRRPRVRSLVAIGADYAWIAGAIAVVTWFPHPLLYVASVIVIGARQHSLLTLLHEAAHRQLSSVAWLNDAAGEMFCAWPFLVDLPTYRRFHLDHHRHVNTDADPERIFKRSAPGEWGLPRSARSLYRMLVGDLFGAHAGSFLAYARAMKRIAGVEPSVGYRTTQLAIGLVIVAILVVSGTWLHALAFWFVPASTTLVCFSRLRDLLEHGAVAGTSRLDSARSVLAPPLSRFCFGPRNVGYHVEHHLFPTVPWFRLPDLHRELAAVVDYRSRAHVTGGYVAGIRELAGRTHG